MKYLLAHLRSAAELLSAYHGQEPLAAYLKKYFAAHKKYGSKDRRNISQFCYQYFRLGHLLPIAAVEERLAVAHWLCTADVPEVLQALLPLQLQHTAPNASAGEKLQMLASASDDVLQMHTPWAALVSPAMHLSGYVHSFLQQPGFFIRIRPGHAQGVKRALEQQGIQAQWHSATCVQLPQSTNVELLAQVNRHLVIQDASSQQCGTIIQQVIPAMKGHVWDACAASGGKTIMLHDIYGNAIKPCVSDVRPAILHNLKQRLGQAGISVYQSFVADLSSPGSYSARMNGVDVLLTDVPCTGSGTWARTPEQHYFFTPDTLATYSERQWAIVSNTLPALKKGGYHIYITCSVFAAENEAITERTCSAFPALELLHAETINGTAHQADSMYIAIFRKN